MKFLIPTPLLLLLLLFVTSVVSAQTGNAEKLCAQAQEKFDAKDYSAAVDLYTKAIQLAPKYTAAYSGRAKARLHTLQKGSSVRLGVTPVEIVPFTEKADRDVLQQVIDDYSAAADLAPKDAELYADRAMVKASVDDHIGAVLDLTQAMEFREQAADYIRRGMIKTAIEDTRGAESDFDRAIELDPENAEAYNLRSAIHWQQRNMAAVEQDLLRAIELDSTLAIAWYNLGKYYQDYRGDYARAVELYDISLRYDPEYSQTYNNRGVARFHLHADFDGAIGDYTRAIELGGNNIAALLNRSDMYNRSSRHQEALADAEKAVALHNANPACYDFRGRAKTMLKQYESALDDFDMAESKGHRTPRMYVYRAICLHALGMPSEACYCWRRAHQAGFDDASLGSELREICR